MANLVEIIVRAVNDTKAGFAEAEAGSASLGSKLQKVGLVGGVALAAVGYESVKMATSFDAAMTRINTQAGVPKSAINGLKQGVLDLAGKVGFSPDSLAVSLYHVESAFQSMGISSKSALDITKIAAEGAAVGNSNLEDTTNALTAVMASGIVKMKDASGAMAALNSIVGSGDMKMQDLAEALGTGIMAIGKSYGQTIPQIGAALATFGDNNIRGAKAATALRMTWQALMAPMKAGLPVLQSIGISSDELAKKLEHSGLTGALQDFVNHLIASKVPVSDWGRIVTEVFGKRAGVGIGVLVDQIGRLHGKLADITGQMGKFGSAWATTNQTASQQFKELRASVDSLMISIGEKLLPVVRALVGWLLQHKTATIAIIAVIGTLVAILTTYAIVMKTIQALTIAWAAITKVAAAAQWVLNFAMDANPIGLVVLAIAALIAIIVIVVTHFKFFKQIVVDIWDWIKSHWPLLVGIIGGPIGVVVALVITHFTQIKNFIIRVFDDVLGFIRHWADSVVGFIVSIPSRIGNIGSRIMSNILGGLSNIGGSILHAVGLAHGGVIGAASGGAQGGLRLVGENGPELVRLPSGSTVMSNPDTQAYLGGGSGGGSGSIVLQVQSGGDSAFEQFMVTALKNWVRVRGGGGTDSVQRALGQTF